MLSVWNVLLLITVGSMIALLCFLVGAWVIFKGSRAVPGETFLGGVPLGTVFTIPDADSSPDFPEDKAQANVLQRTEAFLARLPGGAKP